MVAVEYKLTVKLTWASIEVPKAFIAQHLAMDMNKGSVQRQVINELLQIGQKCPIKVITKLGAHVDCILSKLRRMIFRTVSNGSF